MPKSYTDAEKAYLRSRLKEEASDCLTQFGVRRTTVDELVKRVHLPKGTFYLFYPSKELLLFEVLMELHEKIESELLSSLDALSGTEITCEQLTDIICRFYQAAEATPLLKMLTTGEIELLYRKLPPEILANHMTEDQSIIDQIFSRFPQYTDKFIEPFNAAFRSLFMMMLYKREIGEAFDEGLRVLVKGLVQQILN